ncbi:MAG: hypothetical protein CMJ46_03545 [Planctomyces sp.]|nr:hypothetical protein [Planctomyces sp.]
MPSTAFEEALIRLSYRLIILLPFVVFIATRIYRKFPPRDYEPVLYVMGAGAVVGTVIFLITHVFDPELYSPFGNQPDPLWRQTLFAFFVGMLFSLFPALAVKFYWNWKHPQEKTD